MADATSRRRDGANSIRLLPAQLQALARWPAPALTRRPRRSRSSTRGRLLAEHAAFALAVARRAAARSARSTTALWERSSALRVALSRVLEPSAEPWACEEDLRQTQWKMAATHISSTSTRQATTPPMREEVERAREAAYAAHAARVEGGARSRGEAGEARAGARSPCGPRDGQPPGGARRPRAAQGRGAARLGRLAGGGERAAGASVGGPAFRRSAAARRTRERVVCARLRKITRAPFRVLRAATPSSSSRPYFGEPGVVVRVRDEALAGQRLHLRLPYDRAALLLHLHLDRRALRRRARPAARPPFLPSPKATSSIFSRAAPAAVAATWHGSVRS